MSRKKDTHTQLLLVVAVRFAAIYYFSMLMEASEILKSLRCVVVLLSLCGCVLSPGWFLCVAALLVSCVCVATRASLRFSKQRSDVVETPAT